MQRKALVKIPHQLMIRQNRHIELHNEANLLVMIKGTDNRSTSMVTFNGKMLVDVFPQRAT